MSSQFWVEENSILAHAHGPKRVKLEAKMSWPRATWYYSMMDTNPNNPELVEDCCKLAWNEVSKVTSVLFSATWKEKGEVLSSDCADTGRYRSTSKMPMELIWIPILGVACISSLGLALGLILKYSPLTVLKAIWKALKSAELEASFCTQGFPSWWIYIWTSRNN